MTAAHKRSKANGCRAVLCEVSVRFLGARWTLLLAPNGAGMWEL